MPADSTAHFFRDGAYRNRGSKSEHKMHFEIGNEDLNSDFRNSLKFSEYYRNEGKSLCVRVPRPYIFPKHPGAALLKYDQQKIALANAFLSIALTLLSGGQMHIQLSSCN
ncbi:hypothetical protein TNCV_1298101 [Trichonephila clavipes]|nr:hypothetical protein TNCV_1298101 [Trichonephila clavipes]